MPARRPNAKSNADEGNRRKCQRVLLVIQVESIATGASSIGRTEDLSVGGLLILTRDTFEPKTTVTIRFNLPPVPPGHPIECQGVVVRVQPGVHMAVEFLRLREEDRKAIAEYVEQAPRAA